MGRLLEYEEEMQYVKYIPAHDEVATLFRVLTGTRIVKSISGIDPGGKGLSDRTFLPVSVQNSAFDTASNLNLSAQQSYL